MLNILVPISNDSPFFPESEYLYPKTLMEIGGKMMIEIVIQSLLPLPNPKKFIFVITKKDAERHHFNNILKLCTGNACEIVQVEGKTMGAACSCLMAIQHIKGKDPLLISNCDQLVDDDLPTIVRGFQERDLDAGVVCFDSAHPKWSFVRLDEHGNICEAAEKRPISREAVAGLYYFKHGDDFVAAAMQSVEKDASIDGLYYIAPTLNELILAGRKLGIYRIQPEHYHSFYSPTKIKEFESNRKKIETE